MEMMQGGFYNRMNEGQQYGELHVGMGATEMCYSDREPYTVQKVISDKRVVVTADKYERIDGNGASDMQEYRYESTPLWDGERERICTNWFIKQFLHDGKTEANVCKHIQENGSCDGCPFYKMHKPTNGTTLVKCKRGWKALGTERYFTLGMREKYYDYSF